MDKLSVISFTLFLIADVFAIGSLCMPDWIVTNVGGEMNNHSHIAVWVEIAVHSVEK